jgi:hypothetical protein
MTLAFLWALTPYEQGQGKQNKVLWKICRKDVENL